MKTSIVVRAAVLAAVVCGVGAGVVGTAGAQTKRAMTFADLQKIKRVSDPQVSASGKWVLFGVTDVSLEANTKVNHLWVVPIGGGGERQLTSSKAGESGGRFSPDGKWVLFLSAMGGDSQAYLAAWDDAAGVMGEAKKITSLETEVDGVVWSPDSRHFAFVSNVYVECESSLTGSARWEAEAKCNADRDAVEAKNPVKGLVFEHLLYRHWNAYQGKKHSHIFLGSVEGGAPRDLTPGSVVGDHEAPTYGQDVKGYAFAPDGKELAYVVNLDTVPAASTNNDVYVLRLDEAGAAAVKISTSPGSDDAPAYSPDGRWIAFRSQARAGYESDRFRLMIFDREKRSTRELMSKAIPKNEPLMGVPAFDLWIDEFTWAADPGYLIFVSGEKGEAPLYRVNVEGTDLHRFGKVLGEWSGISVAKDNTIVGSLVRVDRPAEIAAVTQQDIDDTTRTFVMDFSKGGHVDLNSKTRPSEEITTASIEPRWLSKQNEALLSELNLSQMESFWFAGALGVKVQGFVVRPPDFDASKKYPVKFLIHGGPQGAWGDAWSYRWNPELFAANGYVVVMVNPRGSTGYGQKFIDDINGDWGGKAFADLMRGLDAAELKFPFIDKTRECALGASYGGYMANWILTHTQRFKCIVTHDGMYNPESAYGSTEEMWFNEWEFRRPGAASPGQPWKYAAGPVAEDPFRKWSPMRFIENAKTPTLVVHSQKDYRLDVSEGFQLFTALQRLGVPSKMLYFPDEGHWVLKPQNSKLWYETVNDWCDKWTHTNAYAGK